MREQIKAHRGDIAALVAKAGDQGLAFARSLVDHKSLAVTAMPRCCWQRRLLDTCLDLTIEEFAGTKVFGCDRNATRSAGNRGWAGRNTRPTL
jgi:hypothetical protein